jgi:hypothetical protein
VGGIYEIAAEMGLQVYANLYTPGCQNCVQLLKEVDNDKGRTQIHRRMEIKGGL